MLEAAAICTATCTATSSMSLAGYGHVAPCMQGIFSKKSPPRKNLEAPLRSTVHAGPLGKAGVVVKLNDKSMGKREVAFDGEILSISGDDGALVRRMALGDCDVKIQGSQVIAVPPTIPKIELKFGTSTEAEQWASEFKQAKFGAPQERINELSRHCLSVEKHLVDLRARCQSSHEQEKQFRSLKKKLTLTQMGFVAAKEEPKKVAVTSALGAWFMSKKPADDGSVKKLNVELQHQQEELDKSRARTDLLKKKLGSDDNDQEVPQDILEMRVFKVWALEASRSLRHKMHQHRENHEQSQAQVVELQGLLDKSRSEPKLENKFEAKPLPPQEPSYKALELTIQASAQESAAEQGTRPSFQPSCLGEYGDTQSAAPRRNIQEENRSANFPSSCRQACPLSEKESAGDFNGMGKSMVAAPLLETQVYEDRSVRLSNLEQHMRDQLDSRTTDPPTVFSSLEEKIRSRQLQVHEDHNRLQQMFQSHLADQKAPPMTIS